MRRFFVPVLVLALAAPVLAQDKPLLPSDLARAKETLTLPRWYISLAIGDAGIARLDRLVASGKGTDEDARWLRESVALPVLDAGRTEVQNIDAKIGGLSTGLTDELPVDRIIMKDGRTFDARVLEETATEVRVQRWIAGGSGAQMKILRTELKELQKGKGSGAEFTPKLDTAKAAGAGALRDLATWCKDKNLARPREYCMWPALRMEPGHADTRTALGLGKEPGVKPGSGRAITFEGREWDAQELKTKLLRDGYVLVGGQWFRGKERMLLLPGLLRYEKQEKKELTIGGGTAMVGNFETQFKSIYNPTSQQYDEEATKTFTHRFYCPEMTIVTGDERPRNETAEKIVVYKIDAGTPNAGDPMVGEVSIPIEVDQPILSAKIMAVAEVDQGRVVCSVETDAGRTEVYKISAKDSSTHAIPHDAVRGRQKFNVIFRIETVAAYKARNDTRRIASLKKSKDKVLQKESVIEHKRLTVDYKVRLFCSNSNTIEAFRATIVCGEAAANLTKLFQDAGCDDLLK